MIIDRFSDDYRKNAHINENLSIQIVISNAAIIVELKMFICYNDR